MVNAHRGEISAELNNETWTLCLTLGALAELENAYGDEDLLALAERFEAGRISATDAIRVISAGLRGGGYDVGAGEVQGWTANGAAAGYIDIVVRLLQATFGQAQPGASANT